MRKPSTQLEALYEVIRSGDYLVLDTETTGIGATSEAVSIAIVQSDGRVMLDTLCHPTSPIPEDAIKVHGITNEMVKNVLPFPSELVEEIVRDRQVIIYNAGYDVPILYRSTDKANLPRVEWYTIAKWHCAMLGFAEIYGDWNSYRGNYRWQPLSAAAQYFKVQQDGAHGALVDCMTTLKVCKAMVEAKPV